MPGICLLLKRFRLNSQLQSALNQKRPFPLLSPRDSINPGVRLLRNQPTDSVAWGDQESCKTNYSGSTLTFVARLLPKPRSHMSVGRCPSECSETISSLLIIKLHFSNYRHSRALQMKIRFGRCNTLGEVRPALPSSDRERQVFNQQSTLPSLEPV